LASSRDLRGTSTAVVLDLAPLFLVPLAAPQAERRMGARRPRAVQPTRAGATPGVLSGVERWWAVETGFPHGLQTPYSRVGAPGVQRDADPLAPGGQFYALLPGL